MDNQKKGRGRPKVFTDEEAKKRKTTYMTNTEWYCDICKNGQNYKLTGKWNHFKSKKHKMNLQIQNLENKINELTI